jgi:hydrogenase maturation protein HypF
MLPDTTGRKSVRLRIAVRGAVQGVGFRPFIYRLANELALHGWVNNSAQGVFIEVEGPRSELEKFLLRLEAEKPPRSFIQSLESSWLDARGYPSFEIRESEAGGAKSALVLPDIATCPDCLREIFDPSNRRYLYPFTNCTNCGPRFSIIEALPYDRANTSMKGFTMCPECRAEYEDPRDRRFHAQPNACPLCGPHIELWDERGKVVVRDEFARILEGGGLTASSPRPSPPKEEREQGGGVGSFDRSNTDGAHNERSQSFEVLASAAEALRQGKILAVKGLGGFHLMVAAHHDEAVRRLRELKHREEKPFALMFPSLESIKVVCEVSPLEERLLRSSEAPITLLRALSSGSGSRLTPRVSPLIAPTNPFLGVMLPYTPLHHLLLSLVAAPIVATSGNLSDEPICTDEQEALERLAGIADLFLVHNRPIVRHVDDSIVRIMAGREMVMRRARGYAPLPVTLPSALLDKTSSDEGQALSVLAVGPHLKNTVALSLGSQAFISQHIGDLETDAAYEAFRRVITDFEKLYETVPSVVASDAHPDYLSTKFARELVAGRENIKEKGLHVTVQHHVAHVFSCMAENELDPPVLGISWDGTGYGLDGSVWGGEFFVMTDNAWERFAHFRRFRLPGGDRSVKEPRRTALGLLYEMFGEDAFARDDLAPVRAFATPELASIRTMLARGLNSPLTSSAGRLFDAVASLAGIRQQVRFEGQAAMELEFAINGLEMDEAYSFVVSAENKGTEPGGETPPELAGGDACATRMPLVLDWAPVVEAVLADIGHGVPAGVISLKFHNALAQAVVAIARAARQERVVLTGGCFQNRYLTERTIARLQQEGFRPYWHQRVPPNDGGIALGQVVGVLRQLRP